MTTATTKPATVVNTNNHNINENKSTATTINNNNKDASQNKTNNQSSSPSSPLKALLLDKEKQTKIILEPRKQVINGVANSNKSVILNSNLNTNNPNNSKPNAITKPPVPSVPVYTTLNNKNSNSNHNNSNKTIASNTSLIKVDNKPETVARHPLVTVYINTECNAGKYIEPKQFKNFVSEFNDSKLGPSPLNKTMRDVLQLIVDSCANKEKVLGMIRAGNGNFAVETIVKDKKVKINLPHFNRSSAFWNYLNNFLGGLDCCKNLVQQDAVTCESCPTNKESLQKAKMVQPSFFQNQTKQQITKQQMIKQQTIKQQPNNSIMNKIGAAANLPKNITVNLNPQENKPAAYNIQPSMKSLKRKSVNEEDGIKINSIKIVKTTPSNTNSNNNNNSANVVKSPIPNNPPPLNKSTNGFKGSNSSLNSLELNQNSLSDPNDWTTEDVISFLKINDPSLDYGELFKQHVRNECKWPFKFLLIF